MKNTTFACKSWSDYQIASSVFLKKNWTDFVSCARAGLVGNIRKFPEIYRNFLRPVIGDEYCVGAGWYKNENKIFNFPTLSWQPNKITISRTTKLTEKHWGQWSLRSVLHFLPIGVEARISTPWSAWGKISFRAEDKMSFEAEKKTGWGKMGFHFFSNIKCYFFPLSSYMLKSVVELELFSNLQHFTNYFPQ